MSKKKTTIIIIILILLALLAFWFFYFYKGKGGPGNNPDDPNSFAGFGNNNNSGDSTGNPADISGYVPGDTANEIDVKLKKVSSMPIAGFGIFTKERLKEIPVVKPVETTPNATSGTSNNTGSEGFDDEEDVAPILDDTRTTTPTTKTTSSTSSSSKTEFVPAVRYVARATGNIYQTFADKINEQKFSSTIIPKVYDAYFDSRAESVAMRYLKDDLRTIATFAGSLPKETLGEEVTGNKEIKGGFLPEDIKDITLSPDLSKIFYLLRTGEFISGVTAGITGDSRTEIFNSPFTEWLSLWPHTNMVTVTTKPTAGIPGYMYTIDPSKKDLIKILGGINGLTTLTSPDGKHVLYGNDMLSMSIYNITNRSVIPVSIKTMPEKCVWSKASDVIYCSVPKSISSSVLYPDEWYQGESSFSDQIWKINIVTGSTTMVIDPMSVMGREDIDGIKLSTDKDQNYLFFINKKDSFLWELKLF